MPLLCKQRALYVKGCVIPNGITDSQGDRLYNEDIKKIFTSFNNQDNFEVYHDDIAIPEVSLLENYISTADERIGHSIAPTGSWNCVIRVDNPEIQQALLTGELGGLSLSNRIAKECKANLHGTVRYKDLPDAECVVPKFISFVEGGANGFGLHVMDYDAYILKSKDVEIDENNGGKIMDFKEFLNGLKSLIKEAETPEEEPAIEKEDKAEEPVEETPAEEPVEEEATEEEPVVEKATEDEADSEPAEEEVEEEPEIEKADDTETEPAEEEAEETTESNLEERVAKLEEAIAKLTAEEEPEEEAEETEPEDEPEDEDTPKITKSEKVIIDEPVTQVNNYYEMTGRDPQTGKKIRK